MYPYNIIFGMDLYSLLLCGGILAAIIVFRILADKTSLSPSLQNLAVISGVFGIGLGYFSAVVFQAFYNMEKNGGAFLLNQNTGATFYGGLLGGAAVFLVLYFAVGHFWFKKREHIYNFFNIADIAVCSVSIAHALGRLGCLMAGCCYGKQTNAWYGIKMLIDGKWQRVVPTQLFETVFLLALFGFFTYRVLRKKGYNLEIYMWAYGVWRFCIEYLRDDYRGDTVISFLTPSQLTAVLMVLGGVAVFFVRKKVGMRNSVND